MSTSASLKTPRRHARAVLLSLAMPDVRERLAGMALTPAVPGPAELKRKLEADAAQWVRLAKELDIKPLD